MVIIIVFQILLITFTPEMDILFSGIYRNENHWLRRVPAPKCHNKELGNMEPLCYSPIWVTAG